MKNKGNRQKTTVGERREAIQGLAVIGVWGMAMTAMLLAMRVFPAQHIVEPPWSAIAAFAGVSLAIILAAVALFVYYEARLNLARDAEMGDCSLCKATHPLTLMLAAKSIGTPEAWKAKHAAKVCAECHIQLPKEEQGAWVWIDGPDGV